MQGSSVWGLGREKILRESKVVSSLSRCSLYIFPLLSLSLSLRIALMAMASMMTMAMVTMTRGSDDNDDDNNQRWP